MSNQRFMIRPERRIVAPVNAVVPVKEYKPKSTANKVGDALWNNKGKLGKAFGLGVLAAIVAAVAESQLNKKSKDKLTKAEENKALRAMDEEFKSPRGFPKGNNILDDDVITPDMLINPRPRKNNVLSKSSMVKPVHKPQEYIDFGNEQKSADVESYPAHLALKPNKYSGLSNIQASREQARLANIGLLGEHLERGANPQSFATKNLLKQVLSGYRGNGKPSSKSTKSRGGARSSIDKFRNEYIMQQLSKVKKPKQLPPPKTLREKKIRQIMQQQEIPRSVAVKYLDASGW